MRPWVLFVAVLVLVALLFAVCWGGLFPRSEWYPAQAAAEEHELQDENEQLGLW